MDKASPYSILSQYSNPLEAEGTTGVSKTWGKHEVLPCKFPQRLSR